MPISSSFSFSVLLNCSIIEYTCEHATNYLLNTSVFMIWMKISQNTEMLELNMLLVKEVHFFCSIEFCVQDVSAKSLSKYSTVQIFNCRDQNTWITLDLQFGMKILCDANTCSTPFERKTECFKREQLTFREPKKIWRETREKTAVDIQIGDFMLRSMKMHEIIL